MDRRLKICFFNSCPVWGGGEKWHFDVATSLDPEQFEVIVGVQQGSALQSRLEAAGVATQPFEITNLSLLNPFRMRQLTRWFRQQQIDVVVLNLPSDLKAAGVAAKRAGVPRIIYRRGSAIPIRNSALNRWLFSSVITEVVANSNETKQTILSRNPDLIDPAKIKVIYNGMNLTPFNGCRPPGEVVGAPLVLGTLGRICRQKNQTFLLDVAAALKQWNLDFRLVIGGDGPLLDALQARAGELDLLDVVEFNGFIEDVPAFMERLDLFLLSSLWEGFGYVMAEAMASGRPVIAFNNSSNPEIVAHGKTGLLTTPRQVQPFCDAILKLNNDRKMLVAMGEGGRQRVETLFAREVQLEKIAAFLLER